jgi:hypothetical protein
VIEPERRQHGGVAEPDPLGVLRDRREHQLRRGGQAELSARMMLDLPEAAIPHLVRQPGLLQRLDNAPVLVILSPGLRILDLREHVDLQMYASSIPVVECSSLCRTAMVCNRRPRDSHGAARATRPTHPHLRAGRARACHPGAGRRLHAVLTAGAMRSGAR